jgi:Acyltransferase
MSTESFIPAEPIYPFMWFMDVAIKQLLRLVHNIDDVVITDADKEMLRSLSEKRVIYLSNHPTTKEPPITYVVGNHMCSRFHYMAAREVFSWGNGAVGEMIKSIGAYSVIAGASDRESLKATRQILAKPGGKLVLFPEGEPTGAENDNLLPFQAGIAQLGIWGLEDAMKSDPKADIYVLPAFVKYRMIGSKESIRENVDKSLEPMEKRLGISKKGKDIVHRLLSIGKRLVERAEAEFGIVPKPDESFDYRIGKLRHTILDYVVEVTGIKNYNKDAHAIDKLRKILSTFEMVFVGLPDPKKELPTLESATWGRKFCQRAYDFIAIKTDYLTAFPTAERIYEWIYRFESEMLRFSYPRPQRAYVNFAKPFQLSQYYAEYKKDKKGTVEKITQRLRADVQSLLDAEMKKSELLFPKDHIFM